MKAKIISWVIDFVLNIFGLKRKPKIEIDRTKQAKDAEKMVRWEREKNREEENAEWEKADESERAKILLRRFNSPNDGG